MTLTINTPWNELLDIASDGGLEPHITIAGTGHGSLGFEIWTEGATTAGLEAANFATEIFDLGGQSTTEIFEHCFNLGCVSRQYNDGERINFAGPLARALADIRSNVGTLQ